MTLRGYRFTLRSHHVKQIRKFRILLLSPSTFRVHPAQPTAPRPPEPHTRHSHPAPPPPAPTASHHPEQTPAALNRLDDLPSNSEVARRCGGYSPCSPWGAQPADASQAN